MTNQIFNEITVPCKKFLTASDHSGLITVAFYFTDIDNTGGKRSFVANVVKLDAKGDICESQAYLGELNFKVGLVAAKLEYFEADYDNKKVTYKQTEDLNHEVGIYFYNSLPDDLGNRTPRYVLLEGGPELVGGDFAYLNTFIYKTSGPKDLMCHYITKDFDKFFQDYPSITYYTSGFYRRYYWDYIAELNTRRSRGDDIESICSYSFYQHLRETRNVDPDIFETYSYLRHDSHVRLKDMLEDYGTKSRSGCFYMDHHDHYLDGSVVKKFLKYVEGLDYLYDTVDMESEADDLVDVMKSILTRRKELFAGATDMDIEAFNMLPDSISTGRIRLSIFTIEEALSEAANGIKDHLPFNLFKTKHMLEDEYKENDDLVKQSDFII